jgi:predicted nucleotidyltransferase
MDLGHPLRSLIPSLDWAVLEVLAGTQSGLGSSQIARLSKDGSRSGQSPVLDRLVRHGIVLAEPANQGFLYRLNRDHLLAPAILGASRIREQLLDLLSTEARRLQPLPVHASVFGSFARGDADEQSDLDLLLLASTDDDELQWDAQIDELAARVERWTGNRCSCMVFTTERVRQLAIQREPVVDNWMKDGLVIIGHSLDHLLNRQSAGTAKSTRRSRKAR